MSLVVSKTPYRISFFGGGTDYPDWYREEGGQVLSTTIDKYCYITCRLLPEFFPPQHRIIWASIEHVANVADIRHPAVREALLMMGYDDSRGIEIIHQGELPARSGMGSSSAFAAGLIYGLSLLKGEDLGQSNIYRHAIELEQQRLAEHVGSQDQVAVSVGGMNHIRFGPGDQIEIDPLEIDEQRKTALNDRLMLFFLGRKRFASDIAGEVIANLRARRSDLSQIHEHVELSTSVLKNGSDLDDFGRLLDETWQLKRTLSHSVSNDTVDQVYATATRHGAIGGKLLGAGGTGFMLFYVPHERQAQVRQALDEFIHLPFHFEDGGCRLVSNSEG
ncbi:MAG: kinase [Rhodospirillaceae bacterium]|nr:kinase [Rhodospirillaceae bacterium]